MSTVNHYRFRCVTEGVDVYVWGEALPTLCPNDSAHTINADSITIVETVSPTDVTVLNQQVFPTTSGNTPIFQPNIVPPGYYFYGTGAFDDITNGVVGTGAQLAWQSTGADHTEELRGRFLHHVYILGGHLQAVDATYEDWISLLMEAPASTPEDRTATHNGNANKVATGLGFNIIVPAAGNGDWNVDGATLQKGEINLNLCPVPAGGDDAAQTGWWDWNPLVSPSITPNLNHTGAYNLFDATLPLVRQANRYPCIIPGDVTPAASIKGKKVLPHWTWVFKLYRKGTGTVSLAIRLDTARVKTL